MGAARMYDAYIYASYAATFAPLLLLIGFSFKHLADARARLAALEKSSSAPSSETLRDDMGSA